MAVETIKSTQFDSFVEFANREGVEAKSVAKLGAKDDNGDFHIAVTTDDKVHNLFRGGTAKKDNNAVREEFKRSVYAMFGGESKVPESVKKAMLMGDYDKGRPLTARRILAVKKAVDLETSVFGMAVRQAKDNFYSCAAYSTLSPADQGKGVELVNTLVKMCLADRDALDIVVKNIGYFLTDGVREARSEDKAKAMVTGLLANFEELRSLAKKDPSILTLGKAVLMDLLHGKSFPPGILTQVVSKLKNLDLSEVKRLSSKSIPHSIDLALIQFDANVQKVMIESGAERALDGGDELDPCRTFVAALVVGKCGASCIQNMRQAVDSDNAKKLMTIYNTFIMGGFDQTDLSNGRCEETKIVSNARAKALDLFNVAVKINLGVPADEIDQVTGVRGQLDFDGLYAGNILQRIMDTAGKNVVKERESYLDSTITGKGSGAVRDLYLHRLREEPFGAGDTIKAAIGRATSTLVYLSVCDDCRELAAGRQTSFATMIANTTVKLSNGVTLSKTLDAARDELAQLVTGDANARYDGLDGVTRNKVHIAMALISNGAMNAAFDAHAYGLDLGERKPAYAMDSGAVSTMRSIKFTLTDNGAFDVECDMNRTFRTFTANGTTIQAGAGSSLDLRLTCGITPRGLNRLASLDFSRADTTRSRQAVADETKEMKIESITAEMPPEFRATSADISSTSVHQITVN